MPDIFVSYSHVDNEPPYDGAGWIDHFAKLLRIRLSQRLGCDVQIWHDKAITGSDQLTPTIIAEIERSKVLVSIWSPRYLNSEWCNRELRLFADAVSKRLGSLQLGTRSLLAKVIKTPVETVKERALGMDVDDVIGYRFFVENDQGVSWEVAPNSLEFDEKVVELAHRLSKILVELEGLDPARLDVASPSGKTVYVAESGWDLDTKVDELRRALAQQNHRVLPVTRDHYDPEYADRVRAALREADLSIHLVGNAYGMHADDFDCSVSELQYELAREEGARGSRLVVLPWTARNLEPKDARQAAFVTKLGADPRLMVSSFDEVMTRARDLLVQKSEPPPGKSGTSVYVVFDRRDEDAVEPVRAWLESRGFDLYRSIFEGDESELREYHMQHLVLDDTVVVYHASASELWLQKMLVDMRMAFGGTPSGLRRTRQFCAPVVVMADPRRKDKDGFSNRLVQKVEMYGGFMPAVLEPFAAQWAAGAGSESQAV